MYIVNTTNGNIAATINDGVADTTTDLSLIGKNYANYGELVNENFVRLLENFANDTAPTKPLTGQLYYNTDTKKILAFNGILFKHLNAVNVSVSEPTQNVTGDLWYDSTNAQLKIYITNAWQIIYPSFNSTQGKSGIFAETINDNSGNSHTISSVYVGTVRTAIFATEAFSPNPSLAGFTSLNIGLNLPTTHRYYGNANLALNSVTLNGLDDTQFLRSDIDTSATSNLTVDGNLIVNSDSFVDANLSVLNTFDASDVVVTNQLIATDITTGSTSTPGVFTGDWSLSFGSQLNSSYADLAEKYVSDCDLSPGMVVVFGGEAEITTTDKYADHRFAGIVSTSPAFIMNEDADGYEIALTGRVPCRVKGPVEKGDVLTTSTIPGAAEKLDPKSFVPGCVVGKAMENWDGDRVKIIEVAAGRF
jgi:hypothetical protein